MVAGWQVPQTDVADRAQNVVAHCASSPHAPPWGMVPADGVHMGPKSPSKNLSQASAESVEVQPFVLAADALVPGTLKLGKQLSTHRCLQVVTSP
jgi:hypothetical protein